MLLPCILLPLAVLHSPSHPTSALCLPPSVTEVTIGNKDPFVHFISTRQNFVSRTAIQWNKLSNILLNEASTSSCRAHQSNKIPDPYKNNAIELLLSPMLSLLINFILTA